LCESCFAETLPTGDRVIDVILIEAAIVVLAIVTGALCVPAVVLFAECFAAVLPARRTQPPADAPRPSLGILVPAHNESAVIDRTLRSLRDQLNAGDRLIVIADNCTDDTAEIARRHEAEVIVRENRELRGKGYALTAGLAALLDRPTEVVIVVDADCTLEPGCLDALGHSVARTGRPMQGCYLMPPPANPRPIDVVSALAVLIKNKVRPLGCWRMGLPCLVTGSGAAFPLQTLTATSFAGSHIVEDMQLAVDLALAGQAPRFCPEAVLSASLPDRESAFITQRTRWEHGHLQTLVSQGPRLLAGFLRTGRIDCAALMLDLCVPPLSLLAVVSITVFAGAVGIGAVTADWSLAVLMLLNGGLMGLAVALAWARFGRAQFPLTTLLAVPWYVLVKIPLYAGFLYRRQTAWVRTRRNSQS